MPLPFLSKKQTAAPGVTQTMRKPDEQPKEDKEQEEGDPAIETCCREFKMHLDKGDFKSAAKALRSAFEIMDSEPHVEGEHIDSEDNSFAAMNRKAAKQD